jgi:RNA methyltransferase, TrmH family
MPIAKADRERFLAWRRGVDALMVGTHLEGAVDIREIAWGARNIIVMGGEQRGLTDELAAACDVLARIPMTGRADSLNLAMATGITLFESVRGSR